VVVAYGMLLTRPMLDLAEVGFVNLHFSMLPRWRGAAPVAAAIRAGDLITGVSLMKVTEGLDAGPVVGACEVLIRDTDTRGSLTEKLAGLGAGLLNDELESLMTGEMKATPQNHGSATYAPRLTSRDARIDFALPGEDVARQIRAMAPRPGAFAFWNQKRMRILGVRWSAVPPRVLDSGELFLARGKLWCGVEGGALVLDAIQPPGKRVMPGSAWANGVRGELGFLTAG
jgi:methionyl-tRNA formyltransferase